MALVNHDCDRFKAIGMECPFRRLREDDERDEDDPDDEEAARDAFKFDERALPLVEKKRRVDRGQLDNIRQFPVIAHGDPAMRKALERMAAIQRDGGLQSIPKFRPPGLPLPELGGRELIATLSAIAIMEGLRSLRSTGSGIGSRPVQASERRAAKGLSKALNSRNFGSARTRGRGGLHVNASADLQKLLGFRSIGGPLAGVDSFSETGFN